MPLTAIRRVEFTASTNCMTPLGVAHDFNTFVGSLGRSHQLSQHTPGIAMGLEVRGTIGAPGLRVSDGVAVDGLGRMIVRVDPIGAPVDTLPAAGKTVLVTLRFDESLTQDGVDPAVAPCGMLMQLPTLQLEDAASFAAPGDRVILAMARFDGAGKLLELGGGATATQTRAPVGSVTGALRMRASGASVNGADAMISDPDVAHIAPSGVGLRIAVTDADHRIELGADRGGACDRIELMAKQIAARGPGGAATAIVTTNDRGAGLLSTRSQAGRTMVELGTTGSGDGEAGTVALSTGLGQTAVTLGGLGSGGSVLALNDVGGRTLAELSAVDGAAGALRLSEASGAEAARIDGAGASIRGTLDIGGRAAFDRDALVRGGAQINGSARVRGTFDTDSDANVGGRLHVAGAITTNASVRANGQVQASGSLSTDGSAWAEGWVTSGGGFSLSKPVSNGGNLSARSDGAGAGVWLRNRDDKVTATMQAYADGAGIWLKSNAGHALCNLGTADNGGGFWLRNRSDQVIVYAGPVAGQAHGMIAVKDAAGTTRTWLVGDGTKNFVTPHPKDDTKDIVYACIEGPEAAAYIRGRQTLKDGRARVELAEHFASIVNEENVTIQLTPRSAKSKGLAVVATDAAGFEVAELMEGTGSYDFDYFAAGVRKGFEGYSPVVAKGQLPMRYDSAGPGVGALAGNDIPEAVPPAEMVAPVAPAPMERVEMPRGSPAATLNLDDEGDRASLKTNPPAFPPIDD